VNPLLDPARDEQPEIYVEHSFEVIAIEQDQFFRPTAWGSLILR
jgi:hypothetical protein